MCGPMRAGQRASVDRASFGLLREISEDIIKKVSTFPQVAGFAARRPYPLYRQIPARTSSHRQACGFRREAGQSDGEPGDDRDAIESSSEMPDGLREDLTRRALPFTEAEQANRKEKRCRSNLESWIEFLVLTETGDSGTWSYLFAALQGDSGSSGTWLFGCLKQGDDFVEIGREIGLTGTDGDGVGSTLEASEFGNVWVKNSETHLEVDFYWHGCLLDGQQPTCYICGGGDYGALHLVTASA
ncbi:hypothetical protein DFH06DRAFT_1150823 [Mycena polygramma]|nr:hypothetical protein DFH06DRAFT_1150823 [Mycena polygramma]